MIHPEALDGGFTNSPCPWLGDQPFWQQNASCVSEVLHLVAQDYPSAASVLDFDPSSGELPPDDQRKAMWKLLMGRQHGNQEQSDGKVVIRRERWGAYQAALGRISFGEYSVMEPVPVDPERVYDQALLNGGTPLENGRRLRTSLATEGSDTLVRNVVALTGQRLRGIWEVPGEASVEDLFAVTAADTGADMEKLISRSPWVQDQLSRSGEGWSAPFATEYEMYRLAVEATVFDDIDWRNYKETVHSQPPLGPSTAVEYSCDGQTVTVPPRQEGAATYNLRSGRNCHVINGAATARAQGAPRATSTSIAQEAMAYVSVPDGASLVAVSGAPHLRAAADTAIAYFDHARLNGKRINRMDLAAASWEPRVTDLVAALGELMATMKADLRLRAVLLGGDPNAPELLAI